jgi:hypothetical protein
VDKRELSIVDDGHYRELARVGRDRDEWCRRYAILRESDEQLRLDIASLRESLREHDAHVITLFDWLAESDEHARLFRRFWTVWRSPTQKEAAEKLDMAPASLSEWINSPHDGDERTQLLFDALACRKATRAVVAGIPHMDWLRPRSGNRKTPLRDSREQREDPKTESKLSVGTIAGAKA